LFVREKIEKLKIKKFHFKNSKSEKLEKNILMNFDITTILELSIRSSFDVWD